MKIGPLNDQFPPVIRWTPFEHSDFTIEHLVRLSSEVKYATDCPVCDDEVDVSSGDIHIDTSGYLKMAAGSIATSSGTIRYDIDSQMAAALTSVGAALSIMDQPAFKAMKNVFKLAVEMNYEEETAMMTIANELGVQSQPFVKQDLDMLSYAELIALNEKQHYRMMAQLRDIQSHVDAQNAMRYRRIEATAPDRPAVRPFASACEGIFPDRWKWDDILGKEQKWADEILNQPLNINPTDLAFHDQLAKARIDKFFQPQPYVKKKVSVGLIDMDSMSPLQTSVSEDAIKQLTELVKSSQFEIKSAARTASDAFQSIGRSLRTASTAAVSETGEVNTLADLLKTSKVKNTSDAVDKQLTMFGLKTRYKQHRLPSATSFHIAKARSDDSGKKVIYFDYEADISSAFFKVVDDVEEKTKQHGSMRISYE